MPPLPVIPDTYRAALNWTNGLGITSANVMHFLKASTSASAVAALIDANVTASMWLYVSPAMLMSRLDITPLDGASASYALATSGAKWGGGGTGDAVPAVAQVVSLRTALRGRRHRGRVFLGPVGEGNMSFGQLSGGATLTNTQAAWDAFHAALIAAGLQLVVASYKFPGQVPVTSIVVEQEAATQRRRQSRLR